MNSSALSVFEAFDTFNFQSQKINLFEYNGEIWYIAKEILNIIGSSTGVTSLEKVIITDLGKEHAQKQFLKDALGRLQPHLVISTTALKYYLQRSRKAEAKLLAKELNLDLNIMRSPIEAETLKIIKSTFQHFKPVEQFFVDGFRIDLYFPEQQLAIECMEDYHKRSVLKDQKREEDISKILNCNWIYYYPQDEAFNIGETLNEIIKYIYEV